jgi:TM2 domain-containing membrane protein YozV
VQHHTVSGENNMQIQPGSSRSKVTAGVLAILLGGIGAHKFYLGKTGQGILYLLFSWTFIPLIVGVIEGLMYLGMRDADFAQKYG